MSRGQTKRKRQEALRGRYIWSCSGEKRTSEKMQQECTHRYSKCLDTGGNESKALEGKLLREMSLSPLKSDDFIPTV